MKILDPQSAILTNVEVLAFLTANPPRRPPNPPPNSRNWVPSPDLRDHNTVVKEIHNYTSRLSPHIYKYPRYVHEYELPQAQPQPQPQQSRKQSKSSTSTSNNNNTGDTEEPQAPPRPINNAPTPLDHALRSLITRLKPFGLTKGEVLMIVNLGVGLGGAAGEGEGEGVGEEGGEVVEGGEGEGEGMDVDAVDGQEGEVGEGDGGGGGEENGYDEGAQQQQQDGPMEGEEQGEYAGEAEAAGEGEGEGRAELSEDDYGALALLDTVIEEREERLSNEDVASVLTIIRECLGQGNQGLEG